MILLKIDQLTDRERETLDVAVEMVSKAYAPYSNFRVGAAAMTSTGHIYPGCNQENAAYPACVCGEHVALLNAGSYEHKTPVSILAIVAKSPDKKLEHPVTPCGVCRQVISEFETRHNHPITILLKDDNDRIYKFDGIKELLPFGFNQSFL